MITLSHLKSLRIHSEASQDYDACCREIAANLGLVSKDEAMQTGLVIATSNAGSTASIAYWKQAVDNGVAFALPANFPWTLSNSPGSAIARHCGIRGTNTTLTGDGTSLFAAICEAYDYLEMATLHTCFLVAIDFFTEDSYHDAELWQLSNQLPGMKLFYGQPGDASYLLPPANLPSATSRTLLKLLQSRHVAFQVPCGPVMQVIAGEA